MLLVVVAAALTPNFGTVSAQSSCPYGNCTSGSGSSFPWTELFLALAVILAALILAMLAVYYRRRKPPAGDDRMFREALALREATRLLRLPRERPEIGSSAEAGHYHLEPVEFFGTIPPAFREDGTGTTAAWAKTTSYVVGSGGVESDLDSILAEIDKISGEILKRS